MASEEAPPKTEAPPAAAAAPATTAAPAAAETSDTAAKDDNNNNNNAKNGEKKPNNNRKRRNNRNRKKNSNHKDEEKEGEEPTPETTEEAPDNNNNNNSDKKVNNRQRKRNNRRKKAKETSGDSGNTDEADANTNESPEDENKQDEATNTTNPKKVNKRQQRQRQRKSKQQKGSAADTKPVVSLAPIPSSEDPKSSLIRPDLRIQLASASSSTYSKTLSHDDVVVVPDFMGPEEDLSTYERLSAELQKRASSEETTKSNPKDWPVFQEVVTKICSYFQMDPQSTYSRLNWMEDSSEWESLRHSAAALNKSRAKSQNITVSVSFGACREVALVQASALGGDLQHASKIYLPQPNNSCMTIGRDVNIRFKHGVNALTESQQEAARSSDNEKGGRIAILVWGWVKDIPEEEGSPGLVGKKKQSPRAPKTAAAAEEEAEETTATEPATEVATTTTATTTEEVAVEVPEEVKEKLEEPADGEPDAATDDAASKDEDILEV